MRLLLDTHLIPWWQGAQARVPAAARELVESTPDPVYVSRASLWEIAIKAGLGKLRLDLSRFCERVTADGFSWLPIENAGSWICRCTPTTGALLTACWWRSR